MKITQVKQITDDLSKYCYLKDKNAQITITPWGNEEGFTIDIYDKNESKMINLSYGEIDAINYLIKSLELNKE